MDLAMTLPETELDAIRAHSRRLVRRLGFLKPDLAESGLPASCVHALIEIGARSDLSARDLKEILGLDKSSVSRLLGKLLAADLITETPSPEDARSKQLSLTTDGTEKLAAIEAFARGQVRAALAGLSVGQQRVVRNGLELYADALGGIQNTSQTPAAKLRIQSGWQPGLLGSCIEMHGRHYNKSSGFGCAFEAIVAGGLAEFATRLDRPVNEIWAGHIDERIAGTIAIDGEDLNGAESQGRKPQLAHLRLFIVDPTARGSGLGKALLSEALDFVDTQAFDETHLWTFKGLDVARRMYEASGFQLAEERPGSQWGTPVLEQRFVRKRP
jgi:DNA-binding MarR family transcriptional regulator/GNAT superfamily N-acetyltransferase